MSLLSQCGAAGPSSRGGAAGVPVWLCSLTPLHYASYKGSTETAMALVKAGADVHCKDDDGYGFSGLRPRVAWCAAVRGRRSVPSGWSGRIAWLAVQTHSAA